MRSTFKKVFYPMAILWKNGLCDFSQAIQQRQKHPKKNPRKISAFSCLIFPLMQMPTYPKFLVITLVESPFWITFGKWRFYLGCQYFKVTQTLNFLCPSFLHNAKAILITQIFNSTKIYFRQSISQHTSTSVSLLP